MRFAEELTRRALFTALMRRSPRLRTVRQDELASRGRRVLFIAEDDGAVVGTFQLTFIPNLTGRGALRVKIESVKVSSARRSQGIGAAMMAHAESVARDHGARLLELTSNAKRVDAHRFYERIGYEQSHRGFKKKLS